MIVHPFPKEAWRHDQLPIRKRVQSALKLLVGALRALSLSS
jgi:hypothetical protein